MHGLARFCFLSAIAYALAGMALGIAMAASHDHTLSAAHAHLNLVGFVSMGLYGLFYHVVPVAARGRLARIHVGLATLGVWLLIPGIALATLGKTEALAILGSFATIAAMALFAAVAARARPAPHL